MAAIEKDAFARLWMTESPSAIAERLGMSTGRVYRAAKAFCLPSRSEVLREKEDAEEKPTQEEILTRSAEVRARWSDEERQKRYVGGVAWTPRAAVTKVR